nr:MAG TPA: hypothetical protein [Caudoviricetes sp.]
MNFVYSVRTKQPTLTIAITWRVRIGVKGHLHILQTVIYQPQTKLQKLPIIQIKDKLL